MEIKLNIRPGTIVRRDEFSQTHPPYSIALDGYVIGQPFLDQSAKGPYRNFNHHEAVDRSCTSATCEQVRRAIILGLYDLFKGNKGPKAELWANDCDQDVCLATWILFHPERAAEPWVRTLAYVEDLLDMSAGGYPMPEERDLLGEIRWIFEPYTGKRAEIGKLDADGMFGVIYNVHERIEKFLNGESQILPLLGDFKTIGGGEGWSLTEVTHQHARQKMIESGISAAVELFARGDDNTYHYSVWRKSEYIIGFPVIGILEDLNEAEGFSPSSVNGWGGAENVGGSPRGAGSKLDPGMVEKVVRESIKKRCRLIGR